VGIFVNGGSRNTVYNNLVVGAQYLYSSTGGFLVEAGTAQGYHAAPPS
jgi:hypothetical protein